MKSFKKHEFYQKYTTLDGFKHTAIQMMVALANYAKHEEEGLLKKHTTEILDAFNLVYINPDIIDSLPLFIGLELINEDWKLIELANLVCDWREKLWQKFD